MLGCFFGIINVNLVSTVYKYADIENAENFRKTEKRNYRCANVAEQLSGSLFISYTPWPNVTPNVCSESLTHLKGAVKLWNSVDVDFAVSLGDLIDGQNSGKYGQGNCSSIACLDL